MIKIIITICLIISVPSLFATEEGFQEKKMQMVQRLAKQIELKTKAKACLEAAQDENAIKECHKLTRKDHEALRDEFRLQRKEMKKERKAKKEAKQKKEE